MHKKRGMINVNKIRATTIVDCSCMVAVVVLGILGFPSDTFAAIVTEQITFAVNDDYAKTNPDWKNGAQDMIDAANQILSLNTNKRYAIASFKTFLVRDWNHLTGESAFFFPNTTSPQLPSATPPGT